MLEIVHRAGLYLSTPFGSDTECTYLTLLLTSFFEKGHVPSVTLDSILNCR